MRISNVVFKNATFHKQNAPVTGGICHEFCFLVTNCLFWRERERSRAIFFERTGSINMHFCSLEWLLVSIILSGKFRSSIFWARVQHRGDHHSFQNSYLHAFASVNRGTRPFFRPEVDGSVPQNQRIGSLERHLVRGTRNSSFG